MIVLDTSGLLAIMAEDETHHREASAALAGSRGPYVVPAGILSEAGYMIDARLGGAAVDAFLTDLVDGGFSFDCVDQDLPRIRELVRRYADLPLGIADASVIACAERTNAPILTFDRRDFSVVAREGRIKLTP